MWALEATTWTVADHEAICALLRQEGVIGRRQGMGRGTAEIKDDGEIASIREAIGYAEGAFTMLRAGLRDGGKREGSRRCARRLIYGTTVRLRTSFPPIVAVGIRSALPHARPTTTTRIGQDDFVLVDWGATGRPYKSDLTRVLVTGKVTPRFETIYRTVLAARSAESPRSGRGSRLMTWTPKPAP